jgi:WD40 repeat protein
MAVQGQTEERFLVHELTAQAGSEVVIADRIGVLNINFPSPSPVTPIDPFATVPPLPPSFMRRDEVTKPIIEKLLSKREGVLALTSVQGMGGVGKTVVAADLCHSPEIRNAFPDGILWFTVGRQSELSSADLVQQMAQALNQKFAVYNRAAYQTLLKDKAVLVVLDDVWALADVESFLIGPGRSRLLYTSRDQGLAGSLGAESQNVDILKDDQARLFLSQRSGRHPMPEPQASQILDECSGLVLGLAMVGGALEGKPDSEWSRISALLQNGRRLKKVGVRPVGFGHENLHACIAASVDALNPDDRDRYLKLAVLLEDMLAPWELLQALWGGEKMDVEGVMQLLVDRSLASRDAEGSIRLHDFQLDYVRSEHLYPGALKLQHAALLRSVHVIRPHPEQFATQINGRLLAHKSEQGLATFLQNIEDNASRPRLWPLWPALEPAGSATLRVLEGHTRRVNSVAFSANGQCAVSASADQTVRVWDLKGNEPQRILEGHPSTIYSVAISANGERIVSGSEDNKVRVWDPESDEPPRVLEGHTGAVYLVAITANGERAVSGSGDGTVCVWELNSSQSPRILGGHTGSVHAVAISANGKRVVSGSSDGTVWVWELNSSQSPRVLRGHSGAVHAVATSAKGERVISASSDGTVCVWELNGSQPSHVLTVQTDGVRPDALSAEVERAISVLDDNTLRVWDPKRSEPTRGLEGYRGPVNAVAISANGERGISGDRDVSGEHVISGTHDVALNVWDLKGNDPPRVLKGRFGSFLAVSVSANGERLVSVSADYKARVWEVKDGDSPRVLKGHSGFVRAVAISANGKRVVSGSSDGTVWVWELNSSQPRPWYLRGSRPRPRVLNGHSGSVRAVAISANGERAVSTSDDKTLRVWNLKGSQPPRVLECHSGPDSAIAISANGECAISVSAIKAAVHIWNLNGSQQPRVLEGHAGLINAVAISANGKRAVLASDDKTLRVWDLENGGCLASFTCDAGVLSCAWGADCIFAGDRDGKVHLLRWDE